MNKKTYSAPKIDVEKFLKDCDILTKSSNKTDLEDTGEDFIGSGNWEF